MANDKEAIAERYKLLEASELVRILTVDSEDYQREALEAAQEELRRRGHSEETLRDEVNILQEELAEEEEHESGSLSTILKIACLFVLPGGVLSLYFSLYGRKQAAADAARWSLYGLLTWAGLGLLNLLFLGIK